MAKGNLFQGMARGKVGDVVFYRMNGVQMSRVRNRAPKNPRSVEQLYQRAVIATVMKAYSAGKIIFDHAFQGYTRGEGNMRRFNSVNANILRANLNTDIGTARPLAQQEGRFVNPKSIVSVPVPGLQISEGTLTNRLFYEGSSETHAWWVRGYNDNETIGQYLARLQTVAGDIYTIVYHVVDTKVLVYQVPNINDNFAKIYNSEFGFIRLIVREPEDASKLVSEMTMEDIFIIENEAPFTQFTPTMQMAKGSVTLREFIKRNEGYIGVVGAIRSRIDVDIRSTAYFRNLEKSYGIASGYVLSAWQDWVNKIGVSDLILEGGDTAQAYETATMNTATGMTAVEEEVAQLANEPIEEGRRRPARHRGTRNAKE